MEIITRSVEIECIPDEIPQNFVVDATELMVGQNIRAGEITMPGSARLTGQAEAVIVHVVGHKAEEAPVEAVVAVAEPEVAKKGKKEEPAAPPAAEPKAKKK
jgi:large subunit ribosomal protein L25